MMALNARLSCVGLALAAVSLGCRPGEPPPTVAPGAGLDAAAETPTGPVDDTADAPPPAEDGFVVTLQSHCRDTWNGTLVPGKERKAEPRPTSSGWDRGGFPIGPATNRELSMRPGDSLLLTTPSGGIMALDFDDINAGYGARVEITRECSGVNQTVVRAP